MLNVNNLIAQSLQYLSNNKMFYTMCIAAEVKVELSTQVPFGGFIPKQRKIVLNPILLTKPRSALAILLHEYLHVSQLANVGPLIDVAMSSRQLTKDSAYKLLNIAADIVVNETLHQLRIPILKDVYEDLGIAGVGYEFLDKLGISYKKDESTAYYFYLLLGSDKIEYQEMDSHMFEEMDAETQEQYRKIADRAENTAKKIAAKHGVSLMDLKHTVLSQKLKTVLSQIKVKCQALKHKHTPAQPDFFTLNKFWDHLPGYKISQETPIPACYLFIDVSGSMWNEEYLQQMLAGMKYLLNKHLIAGAATFDDGIQETINLTTYKLQVTGGGGTRLYPFQILDWLKKQTVKKKAHIIVFTDEQIDGIKELKATIDFSLDIINIPEVL